MKKLLCVLLAFIAVSAALVGCVAPSEPVPGEELVLAARKWYRSLDSARVYVDNAKTGDHEQIFVYKYDEKDIMTYSYIGTGEGIHLAQYNNGREQFTDDNGTVTALDASDIRFTAYSRDVPYPMADEGLIIFYKKAIIPEKSFSKEEQWFDGTGIHVRHVYDPAKLGQYDGEGELKSFSVDYYFSDDGSLVSFTENTGIELDGSTSEYFYSVFIDDCNEVERVENVVDISKISE